MTYNWSYSNDYFLGKSIYRNFEKRKTGAVMTTVF